MTDTTLSPVVPGSATLAAAGRLHAVVPPRGPIGLPLPPIPETRQPSAVYAIRRIDSNGRVNDSAILKALDWAPGDQLHWRVRDGLVLVSRPGYGRVGITAYGHISIPARFRHGARLCVGDRVLLAADKTHELLVVFGPATIDEMAAARFARVAAGAQS
ncbi:hypothetical protein [Nocardia sp. NPDC049707]|uniref:hypothetical protein n=1 Tax=Nocardia sp. NPDC049707 TaxID=3154735 RepID=UPI00341DEA64